MDNIVTQKALQRCMDFLNGKIKSLGIEPPNWNQNDPSGAGYIQNRTHYKEVNTQTIQIGSPTARIVPRFTQVGDKFFGMLYVSSGSQFGTNPPERTIDLRNALMDSYADNQNNGFPGIFDEITTWTTESEVEATIQGDTVIFLEMEITAGDTSDSEFIPSAYNLNWYAVPVTLVNNYWAADDNGVFVTPQNFLATRDVESHIDSLYDAMDAWTLANYGFKRNPDEGGMYRWVDANGDDITTPIPLEDMMDCSLHFQSVILADYVVQVGDSTLITGVDNNYFPEESLSINIFPDSIYKSAFAFAAPTVDNPRDQRKIRVGYWTERSGMTSDNDDVIYERDGFVASLCPAIYMFYDYDVSVTGTDIPGYNQEDIDAWEDAMSAITLADLGLSYGFHKVITETIYHKLDPNYLPSGSGGGGNAALEISISEQDIAAIQNDGGIWDLTKAQMAQHLSITEQQVDELFAMKYSLYKIADAGPGGGDYIGTLTSMPQQGAAVACDVESVMLDMLANMIGSWNAMVAGGTPSEVSWGFMLGFQSYEDNGTTLYAICNLND